MHILFLDLPATFPPAYLNADSPDQILLCHQPLSLVLQQASDLVVQSVFLLLHVHQLTLQVED